MKQLYQALSGMFSGNAAETITVDDQPSVIHRLKAWWYGNTLVVRQAGGGGRDVRLRVRQAKTARRPGGCKPSDEKQNGQKGKTTPPCARQASHRPVSTAPSIPRFASTLEGTESLFDLDQAALYQELWGGRQNFPGGINRALEVMGPILRAAKRGDSLLDFGAGCGGLLRHLKNFYGIDVAGFDRSPDLVSGSEDMVSQLDVDNPDFGEETFDYVASLDGLQDIATRRKILKAAAKALKPGGQMLLVDAMTVDSGGVLNCKDGARGRGFQTTVLSSKVYGALLRDCGLKVADTSNISNTYGQDVLKGWADATRRLKQRKMSKEAKALMDQESGRWFAKVRALREGEATMMRMVLTK